MSNNSDRFLDTWAGLNSLCFLSFFKKYKLNFCRKNIIVIVSILITIGFRKQYLLRATSTNKYFDQTNYLCYNKREDPPLSQHFTQKSKNQPQKFHIVFLRTSHLASGKERREEILSRDKIILLRCRPL